MSINDEISSDIRSQHSPPRQKEWQQLVFAWAGVGHDYVWRASVEQKDEKQK